MKKLKRILIIAIIIIAIVLIIKSFIGSKIEEFNNIDSMYMNEWFNTYTVSKDDVKSYVKGMGTITSFNIETINIEIDEKISEILVSEGQRVEKNQDIMKVTNGTTSRTIKSNISGMFFCIEEEAGTKYCIYNLDDIGVKLSLPEKDIASVAIGQSVTVNVSAINKEFAGTVSYISSLPQNDRYIVRVKIDYNDEIKFGYSTISSILTHEIKDSIVVPYEYVNMTDDGKYYIYKIDQKDKLYNATFSDGKIDDAEKTYVEVGTITSNFIEIKSGLEVGEEIIALNW